MPSLVTKSSEVLVFIGAGATASLGMPTTDAQSQLLRKLINKDTDISKILLEYGFYDAERRNMLTAFLEFSGGIANNDFNTITPKDIRNAKIAFAIGDSSVIDNLLKRRILELRQKYDWMALREVLKICPLNETKDNLIRDAYTLLDKKISSQQGLKIPSSHNAEQAEVLSCSRLIAARSMLTLLISILFAEAWQKICDGDKPEAFAKYEKFADTFSKMMQRESSKFEKYPKEEHSFLLFSTSFISFNFEMIFLWLLYIKNRERNEELFYLKSANRMSQWLDFGCLHKRRPVKANPDRHQSGVFGTTFDETSAARLNASDVSNAKFARVGKFLFAHGSSAWRECPACGRMMFYQGDEWKLKSKTLNPPFPIPLYNDFTRTPKEQEWENQLKYDSLECLACGAETSAADSPMVMQSLYKGSPTSFIEEIQREVKVALDAARHIVLLGYSFPIDDVVWQQVFAEAVRYRAETTQAAYCSIVVGTKGPQHWIYSEELQEYLSKHRHNENADSYGVTAIENAIAIFGKDKVRAYTGGIPQVFGDADESAVNQLLYPQNFVRWDETRI